MSLEHLVFWIALGLLCYVYLGYPMVMMLYAAARREERQPAGELPTITVVVAAYNEEHRIGQRLENLLSLDYPPERLEVVVGSDGSSDGTVAHARQFEPRGVRVYAFAFRRGKPAMLNDLVPRATGDIVVLADARQQFAPEALRSLVAPFADPRVGAVSGELMLDRTPGSPVGQGVGLYWQYEKYIRRVESRVDSTVGATGAIYAIRRTLYRPIPEDTILDDVLIPMQVVKAGYRVLFESAAQAFDRAAASGREEFTRKARTLAGSFQLFARHPWMLSPSDNRLWMQTVSHKLLRLFGPVLLLLAFATNALLVAEPLYAATFACQGLFYTAGVAGAVAKSRGWRSRLLTLPYTFCLLNLATLAGLWRFAIGRQTVTWDRAQPAEKQTRAVWAGRVRG